MICPYVEEFIIIVEYAFLPDIFSSNICSEIEKVIGFFGGIVDEPCKITNFLLSTETDSSGVIVSFITDYVQLLFGNELGLEDIDFCEDIDVLSTLVGVLPSLPCKISEVFSTCRDDDRIICTLFGIVEDFAGYLDPAISDIFYIQFCEEQKFIENVIGTVLYSPCTSVKYLRDCEENSSLCGLSSSLLSDFQQVDVCAEQDVVEEIWGLIDYPCEALTIMTNTCKDSSAELCSAVTAGAAYLDTLTSGSTMELCYDQTWLMSLASSVYSDPCSVTQLLSAASEADCGESYSCQILADLLLFLYTMEDLPDIG